jgi:hypothetical protein
LPPAIQAELHQIAQEALNNALKHSHASRVQVHLHFGDAVTKVTVRRDRIEVWRGLPEWQVADLALGDPNDDGRGEILLALWKQDAEGEMRTHPFIVGYRAGAYRVLWGGSAVVDPILEVELGDVDGDGVQELIVLEEMATGRAVSLWRWHGWGFSLMWRSPPGRYRGLGVIQVDAGQPPVITVAGLP